MDLFEGNKAETKTLIPVLTRFRDRHQAHDIVVVADAGMLSAANLLALGGQRVPVHRRLPAGKIPYELEAHVERHGNYLADGATIETTRHMGAGKKARVKPPSAQHRAAEIPRIWDRKAYVFAAVWSFHRSEEET